MRNRLSLFVRINILLGITPLFIAPGAETQGAKWYNLTPEQVFHCELALKPGESKPLDIASGEPVIVGFMSNMTRAKVKQYGEKKENPIQFSTRDGKLSIASCIGAGTKFTPQKGSVALKITNGADVALQIVIYTKASKPAQ